MPTAIHKLCQTAINSTRAHPWTPVLEYLTQHHGSSSGTQLSSDLLKCDDEGRTPLSLAVQGGAPEMIVRAMLSVENGACEIEDHDGWLPIHWACKRPTTHTVNTTDNTPYCPQHQILTHLTQANPTSIVTATKNTLQTPLHVALTHYANTRTVDTLSYLVGGGNVRGTLPNEVLGLVDGQGRLALHCAVGGRVRASKDVVKRLVQGYKAGVEDQDLQGCVPLHSYLKSCATKSTDEDTEDEEVETLSSSMITLLLTPTAASLCNSTEQTVLHCAVEANTAITSKALRSIIDINRSALIAQDDQGRTPLHLFFVLKHKQKKHLDPLLQPICEDDVSSAVKVEDEYGRLPLHYAVTSELNLLQGVLQGYEEGVLHVDHDGCTPLHYLFQGDSDDVSMGVLLALLHSHTSTPRILDSESNLALHHACAMGNVQVEVLAVLLEQGGANLANDHGLLPVHCAILGAVGDVSDVSDDVIMDKLASVDAGMVEMLLRPLIDDVTACKLAGVGDLYPLVIATQEHIADFMSDDVILAILKNHPDAVEYITDVTNLADAVGDAVFVYAEDKTKFGDANERLERLANLAREQCAAGDMDDVSKLYWKWLCSSDDVSNADHVTTIITGLTNLAIQELLQLLDDVSVTSSVQDVLDAVQYFCGLFVLGDVIHQSADVIILDGYMQSHGTGSPTPVVLKFMSNTADYQRAIKLANNDVTGVIPVLQHYSVEGSRADDVRFKVDLADTDRFGNILHGDVAILAAVVYPRGRRDLQEALLHGVITNTNTNAILSSIGTGIANLHARHLIHGDLRVTNVIDLDGSYYVTNLASCTSHRRRHQFSSGILTPDVVYEFQTLQDIQDACGTHVIYMCHDGDAFCIKDSTNGTANVNVPYSTPKMTKYADVWAYGLIMFYLLTGEHLFAVNAHMQITDADVIRKLCRWDEDAAKLAIYRKVEDPLAQDLLLHILVPSKGSKMSMEVVLKHPFFKDVKSKKALQCIEARLAEAMVWRRDASERRAVMDQARLLADRTVVLKRTSLEVQLMLDHATSSQANLVYGNTELHHPSAIMVLPYRLAPNKRGQLTPMTKADVELAEQVGLHVLHIRKYLAFYRALTATASAKGAAFVAKMILWCSKLEENPDDDNDDVIGEMLEAMALEGTYYGNACRDMMLLAIQDAPEKLLMDPLCYAKRELNRRVEQVCQICHGKKVYLYLVDEVTGLPLVYHKKKESLDGNHSAEVAEAVKITYPFQLPDDMSDFTFRLVLPFMLMTIFHVSAKEGVAGFVKLIFEAAYPHVPPTWTNLCQDLVFDYDLKLFINEVQLLRDALEDIHPLNEKTELELLHHLLEDTVDPQRRYAGLKRVCDGKVSIWTAEDHAARIAKECEEGDAAKIVQRYKAMKTLQAELDQRDARIEELERLLREKEAEGGDDDEVLQHEDQIEACNEVEETVSIEQSTNEEEKVEDDLSFLTMS